MFIMSLLPANSVILKVLETIVYKNAVLLVVFGYSFIILLLGFLKKRKKPVLKADLSE